METLREQLVQLEDAGANTTGLKMRGMRYREDTQTALSLIQYIDSNLQTIRCVLCWNLSKRGLFYFSESLKSHVSLRVPTRAGLICQ